MPPDVRWPGDLPHLAERVAQLDRTSQQLQESRARLVDANNDGRRTLEARHLP